MLKYAGKYGIPYLDFNQKLKELGIDWKSDTLDKGDHLNLSGAHKVTDYMTAYLQEHYMLPDHRGDEKFTSWDTCLLYTSHIICRRIYSTQSEYDSDDFCVLCLCDAGADIPEDGWLFLCKYHVHR